MSEHSAMYFKKISEKLEKRANEAMPKREFTFSQGKVLWYLHKHDNESVTLKDVERFLDCSHATVSGLVSRLVEKGLVTLETNENDRRSKVLKLTEKELKNFRAMKEHRTQMEELLLQGFSEEERETLVALLKRVYQNVSDGKEECCRCTSRRKKV